MPDTSSAARDTSPLSLDEITGAVIDASIKIHRDLGPGLLESVYERVLARELERRGLRVQRQVDLSFVYDGIAFNHGLRVDLLVHDTVVVELKSVEKLAPVHFKHVLTYLRLLKLPVGLLINFGAATLKEGLRRLANHLDPVDSPSLRVNREAADESARQNFHDSARDTGAARH